MKSHALQESGENPEQTLPAVMGTKAAECHWETGKARK